MKKLSKKAEMVIQQMEDDGWTWVEFFPGICMVMHKGGLVKTVKNNGTVVDGDKGPQ